MSRSDQLAEIMGIVRQWWDARDADAGIGEAISEMLGELKPSDTTMGAIGRALVAILTDVPDAALERVLARAREDLSNLETSTREP